MIQPEYGSLLSDKLHSSPVLGALGPNPAREASRDISKNRGNQTRKEAIKLNTPIRRTLSDGNTTITIHVHTKGTYNIYNDTRCVYPAHTVASGHAGG